MQRQGDFEFSAVHVLVVVAFQFRVLAGASPVVAGGDQGDVGAGGVGFLGDVGEDVVAAVAVDDDQAVDAGGLERAPYVVDEGVQGGGADADGAGERGVFVGAGEGEGWADHGGEVVLIDGTLIPTQRRTGKADRKNYSGKHHTHGLHFLALTDEKGRLIWISAARPGRTHNATAARHDKIVEHLKAAGLGALADLGFLGVDKPADPDDLAIVTGYKATRWRKLTPGQKQANRVLAAGGTPVEHGFANLKAWRVLTKLRTDPGRATQLLRALLVLTNLEVNR